MSQPSNQVVVNADFKGNTALEALEAAETEQKSLPFNVTWTTIELTKLFGSQDEEDKENVSIWVATLKARGLSRS